MDVRGTILLAGRDKGTFSDVFQMIIEISPHRVLMVSNSKRNIHRALEDWTAAVKWTFTYYLHTLYQAGLPRCRGLLRGVATPAVLCDKEPARRSSQLRALERKKTLAGSFWYRGIPIIEHGSQLSLCHKEPARSKQKDPLPRWTSTNESGPHSYVWGKMCCLYLYAI